MDMSAVYPPLVAVYLLGAHASAAIRVPAEISDEMFSLVRDVLRDFGEEIQCTEDLEVAARASRPKRRRSNRKKIRSRFGIVQTICRWGTGWQMFRAMFSESNSDLF